MYYRPLSVIMLRGDSSKIKHGKLLLLLPAWWGIRHASDRRRLNRFNTVSMGYLTFTGVDSSKNIGGCKPKFSEEDGNNWRKLAWALPNYWGARAGCPKSLRIWLLSQGNPNNLVKWCKPPRLACGLLSHTPTVKSAGPSPPANFPPSWHPLPDTFLHPTYNRRSNLHPGVLYKSLLIMSHSYIPQVVHSTGNKDSK